MQATESELVIAANYRPYYRRLFFLVSLTYLLGIVVMLGFLLYFIHLDTSVPGLPDLQEHLQETRQHGILLFAGFLVFFLALYGLFVPLYRHRIREADCVFRVTQEGISICPAALLIRWSEIKTLSERKLPLIGMTYLQVAFQKGAGFSERIQASSASPFVRRSIALGVLLSKPPSLTAVVEPALPISIGELLTNIQEQFAPSLRAHHILVERRR